MEVQRATQLHISALEKVQFENQKFFKNSINYHKSQALRITHHIVWKHNLLLMMEALKKIK